MAGTKISDATTTTPTGTDMIPFARVADATVRHVTNAALFAGITTTVSLDDGSGNSPFLNLVGGSNDDTGSFWLYDDAAAGESDLAIRLPGDYNASQLKIFNSQIMLQHYFGAAGAVVLNEYGNDADFRVESDGDANMLFVDGGNNRVGIGTATPKGMSLQLGNGISALTFNDYMDADGSFTICHNAYNEGTTPTYKWIGTHGTFGSRVIEFDFNEGILFYADSVASTADAAFTPTLRMVIRHDGKVGIGTATPSEMLDIYGSGHKIVLTDSGAAGALRLTIAHIDGSGGLIDLYDDSDTNTVRIRSYVSGVVQGYFNAGYMGFGDTDPAFRIELPNTASNAGQGNANAWNTYASSEEWKKDIVEISLATDKIKMLKGTTFKHNYPKGKKGFESNDIETVGISAEDLDSLGLPNLVSRDDEGDYYSINLTNLIPVLVQAIKELNEKIEALQ